MSLEAIDISRKTGEEKFYSELGEKDFRLLDFWQWSTSDLLSNATRGRLAEYLVGKNLGLVKFVRSEWDSYDLRENDGTKIEIKTSAYLQSWYQNKLSRIIFDIKPTVYWNPKTNEFTGELQRQSDFYIFCLLHHKDKKNVDPLNLDQWTFYILETDTLNRELLDQKQISLNKLLKLKPVICKYAQIKKCLKKKKTHHNNV